MKLKFKAACKSPTTDCGFSLPVAMGTGLVLLMVGALLIARSMQSQAISIGRSHASNSLAVAEAGVARTLAQLTKANNAVLLTRNYDTINPKTNKTYFGPDATFNNGDEESTAIDEWANPTVVSSPCVAATNSALPDIYSSYTGTVGSDPSNVYTLRAYRYNSANQTGTFLIEGKQGDFASAYIAVTISIDSNFVTFPGIRTTESVYLQGRQVLGRNGNVFYHPDFSANSNLNGSAAPGDASRPQYLNAIWAGSTDGFSTDPVPGKIVACKQNFVLPDTPQGTNLPAIKGVMQINGPGNYQTSKVEMKNNDTLTVDTTAGPVYLYVDGTFSMKNSSKIVNVRSDGKPPRVGDLRIIESAGNGFEFALYDNACIQDAFLYNRLSDLQIQTSGDGCPSSGSTNVEGVVWVEDLLSSNTSATTRPDPDGDQDIISTIGATSGIAISDDVSSLSDILNSSNWPTKNKIRAVKSWERKQL